MMEKHSTEFPWLQAKVSVVRNTVDNILKVGGYQLYISYICVLCIQSWNSTQFLYEMENTKIPVIITYNFLGSFKCKPWSWDCTKRDLFVYDQFCFNFTSRNVINIHFWYFSKFSATNCQLVEYSLEIWDNLKSFHCP